MGGAMQSELLIIIFVLAISSLLNLVYLAEYFGLPEVADFWESIVKLNNWHQHRISSLIIGYDHLFGKNLEASVNDLINYGKTYNFKVDVIEAQDISSIIVSSTKIRSAVKASKFKQVHRFLGRPYELNGKVIKRKKELKKNNICALLEQS